MATPPTQDAVKSIRVTEDVHARLLRLSAGMHGASMNDVIDWLLSPSMVRVALTEQQKDRWRQAASGLGMDIPNFVIARVESAIAHGADPLALKRIFDICYALARQSGIVPPPSILNLDGTVIDPK